jgi:hypothetical protein
MSVALSGHDWRLATADATMGTVFARNRESAGRAKVTGVTMFAARCGWYVRALGLNPLIRCTDRLEAFAVLAAVVAAFFALPAAAMAGTMIYESGVSAAAEQSQSRHSVDALVVDGAGLPTDFETPASVSAQWTDGTQTHTERIVSPATVRTGDHMTVWLDAAGEVVAAPRTAADAKIGGVAVAVAVWLTVVACGAVLAYVVRNGLDRSRDRAWERELHLLAHNDDGWANRHT